MKTYKNLFEKYISDENIIQAIESAMKGHKAKRTKRKLKSIYANKEVWIPKLKSIASDFHNHSHTPKEIYDGISRKKRTIIVPNVVELIIQHMQVNILKPIFLKGIYEHTYAAIPDRGSHIGKKRMEKWIRKDKKNTKYYLKLDIRHFFESIDKDVLKEMLAKIIRDDRFLKQLYEVIDVVDKGLPLGFYTSQWYANWYFKKADKYIKQQLGVKYYIRYMDDIVILGGNKRKLHKVLADMKVWLKNNFYLTIKQNHRLSVVGTNKNNYIDFMGFKFYSNRTTLRKSIMLKACRKAKKISRKDRITVHDSRQMLAYTGWLYITNTYNMYKKRIKPLVKIKTLKKVVSRYDRRHGTNVVHK